MPIYEYKCENGHLFDIMQKLSDEPLTSCIEWVGLLLDRLQERREERSPGQERRVGR